MLARLKGFDKVFAKLLLLMRGHVYVNGIHNIHIL